MDSEPRAAIRVNYQDIPRATRGTSVFRDIGELFQFEFHAADVLAVPHETSVLLLDCARLTWRIDDFVSDLDNGILSYDGLMTCRSVSQIRYELPPIWNWLDNAGRIPPNDVALIHYTVTSTQPWLSAGHPLGQLWLETLFDAIDQREIYRAEVEQSVKRGFVRPSLLFQVDERVVSKRELPAEIIEKDHPFDKYCQSVRHVIVDGFRG